MEKSCRNVHQKLVLDPLLILVINPKHPLHARNSFENNILKKDCQKALKKLTLFFLLSPVSFNGQNYQNKIFLELETSRSSGYEISSEKFLY